MVCVNKFVNNGPFAAERSFGTNCQTGEQMMHWDMLDKASKFEFSLFNMSSASFAHQFGDFVPCDLSAAKGPLLFPGTFLLSFLQKEYKKQ